MGNAKTRQRRIYILVFSQKEEKRRRFLKEGTRETVLVRKQEIFTFYRGRKI